MARLRRLPDTGTFGPRDPAMVTLADVLDGWRPIDPEAARVWRDRRRTLCAAVTGGPFDPRRILTLKTARDRDAWREARAAWARQAFAGDPRVRAGEDV